MKIIPIATVALVAASAVILAGAPAQAAGPQVGTTSSVSQHKDNPTFTQHKDKPTFTQHKDNPTLHG